MNVVVDFFLGGGIFLLAIATVDLMVVPTFVLYI
jgi:hypothetical protein